MVFCHTEKRDIPFFDENGEDELHHTYDQGLDYWYYKKWEGPSGYEGERVADLIIQSVKYGSAILQMELGEKLFMAVINWKKYGWEDKIILLRPRLCRVYESEKNIIPETTT